MYALLLLGHGSQNTAQPNCVCLAIARTWQPKYVVLLVFDILKPIYFRCVILINLITLLILDLSL